MQMVGCISNLWKVRNDRSHILIQRVIIFIIPPLFVHTHLNTGPDKCNSLKILRSFALDSRERWMIKSIENDIVEISVYRLAFEPFHLCLYIPHVL